MDPLIEPSTDHSAGYASQTVPPHQKKSALPDIEDTNQRIDPLSLINSLPQKTANILDITENIPLRASVASTSANFESLQPISAFKPVESVLPIDSNPKTILPIAPAGTANPFVSSNADQSYENFEESWVYQVTNSGNFTKKDEEILNLKLLSDNDESVNVDVGSASEISYSKASVDHSIDDSPTDVFNTCEIDRIAKTDSNVNSLKILTSKKKGTTERHFPPVMISQSIYKSQQQLSNVLADEITPVNTDSEIYPNESCSSEFHLTSIHSTCVSSFENTKFTEPFQPHMPRISSETRNDKRGSMHRTCSTSSDMPLDALNYSSKKNNDSFKNLKTDLDDVTFLERMCDKGQHGRVPDLSIGHDVNLIRASQSIQSSHSSSSGQFEALHASQSITQLPKNIKQKFHEHSRGTENYIKLSRDADISPMPSNSRAGFTSHTDRGPWLDYHLYKNLFTSSWNSSQNTQYFVPNHTSRNPFLINSAALSQMPSKFFEDFRDNPTKATEFVDPIEYIFPSTHEPAGPKRFLQGDIDDLRRKWTQSRTSVSDEKSQNDIENQSRVLVTTRFFSFEIKLKSEWQQILSRRDPALCEIIETLKENCDAATPVTHDDLTPESDKLRRISFAKHMAKQEDSIGIPHPVSRQGSSAYLSNLANPNLMHENSTHKSISSDSDCLWCITQNEFTSDIANYIPGPTVTLTIADPGIYVDEIVSNTTLQKVLWNDLCDFLSTKNCVPVLLDPLARAESFCSDVLNRLFHYCTPPLGTGFSYLDWPGYVSLNEKFLDAVAKVFKDPDYIIIYDYHFLLLPGLLRDSYPLAKIAMYFESVFPSSEMFRILPQRETLLRGILCANLIAFHSFQYKRHFLTACTRLLGVECTNEGIKPFPEGGSTGSRVAMVPLGINVTPWIERINTVSCREKIQELKGKFAGRKVIIGIDFLDHVRGIPHKLLAFHKFLTLNPSWASKVVFLQIAMTKTSEKGVGAYRSRMPVIDQQELLSQIFQVCGMVNAEFGSVDALPVHFLNSSLKVDALVPLYACADIAVITSLRESLSWIAYEFILCQRSSNMGVLILSEFSGSTQSLGAAAICVNPWDTASFASAFYDALVMPEQEKFERHQYAYNYIMKHNMSRWGSRLMAELKDAVNDLQHERISVPPLLNAEEVITALVSCPHRFIILGLRGALIPSSQIGIDPLLKHSCSLAEEVDWALSVLSADAHTTVFILSTATVKMLEQTVGHHPELYLLAENGHFFRPPNADEFLHEVTETDNSWMDSVEETFRYFVQRTPGSFIDRTETTVAWHYQNTQREHGAIQAKDLLIHLWSGALRTRCQADIVVGYQSVEVRSQHASKACSLEKYLRQVINSKKLRAEECFFLCVGNPLPRDEEIYQTVHNIADERQVARSSASPRTLDISSLSSQTPQTNEYMLISGETISRIGSIDYSVSPVQHSGFFSGDDPAAGMNVPHLEGTNGFKKLDSSQHFSESQRVFCCTVGQKRSRADFHVSNEKSVELLLTSLAYRIAPTRFKSPPSVDTHRLGGFNLPQWRDSISSPQIPMYSNLSLSNNQYKNYECPHFENMGFDYVPTGQAASYVQNGAFCTINTPLGWHFYSNGYYIPPHLQSSLVHVRPNSLYPVNTSANYMNKIEEIPFEVPNTTNTDFVNALEANFKEINYNNIPSQNSTTEVPYGVKRSSNADLLQLQQNDLVTDAVSNTSPTVSSMRRIDNDCSTMNMNLETSTHTVDTSDLGRNM